MNITLCKASNGYSIALVDEGAAGDAEWERVRAAGEPWPLLFRALWVHEKHATTALDVVRKKFSEAEPPK